MKALSLTQPMAWAIFHGKDVENRNWNTHYRGPLLIHASMKFDAAHLQWLKDNQGKLGITLPNRFYHGALLGIVTLERVMRKGSQEAIIGVPAPSIGDQERELECLRKANSEYFSPWFFGPYGFVLKDAKPLSEPIPYRGMLGLFEVPDAILPVEVKGR